MVRKKGREWWLGEVEPWRGGQSTTRNLRLWREIVAR